jgi:hypothetical protein
MIAGPDSRAQLAIQAAERLRTLGAGVPWEVCPPLPPRLIAALTVIPGVTPETAYVLLVGIAFLGSAWAVFRLWRTMGADGRVALQAALLALLAPSGWIAILERGEIDRLLFWKLVPFLFLAVDLFRRRPRAPRVAVVLVALAAMTLTRSWDILALDVLAIAEWVILLALCRPWRADARNDQLARVGSAAVFVAVGFAELAAARDPGALDPMPPALVARAAQPVIGPVSLEARLHPALGKVHELINSDLRPRESVLWLQALGARSVIAPAHGKFARELECVAEEQGWCVFDVGGLAPPAALVSRERFETLKPIRGLFDVEGLERYLLWAIRPEAVGYERDRDRAVVRAHPAPNDLVLVRVRARDWVEDEASFSSWPAQDPIGFSVLDFAKPSVLDPERVPRNEVWLRHVGDGKTLARHRPEPIDLDDADYPRILPEGVVEATSYTPPPFQPGVYVSIFGEHFRPEASRVLIDDAEPAIEYISVDQINIRLPESLAPGEHSLVVESARRPSYPYVFEVAAP